MGECRAEGKLMKVAVNFNILMGALKLEAKGKKSIFLVVDKLSR